MGFYCFLFLSSFHCGKKNNHPSQEHLHFSSSGLNLFPHSCTFAKHELSFSLLHEWG